MVGLYKFKSFKDASKSVFESFYINGFRLDRACEFLAAFTGTSSPPYPPGLYKFKSFREARASDCRACIESSVRRKKK